MEYSYEKIQEALEKQVDYQEITELLELDLNTIAEEVVEDPTKKIEFKVFFDSGEFNSVINQQEAGEGDGMFITPILFKFVNGDYSTMKGPKFFSTTFSIEVMGFERDRQNLRKIFETYSYMNQGIIEEGNNMHMTKVLEFPYFGEQFPLKGMDRVQGFMRLFISYMYSGQMSNSVVYMLDDDEVEIQGFAISRERTPRADQMNTEEEVTNIYESQIITFSGSMMYDGSDAAKKLLRAIKTLNFGLNQKYNFEITFPNIYDEDPETPDIDLYRVYLDSGTISIDEGGVLFLNFTFTLAEV